MAVPGPAPAAPAQGTNGGNGRKWHGRWHGAMCRVQPAWRRAQGPPHSIPSLLALCPQQSPTAAEPRSPAHAGMWSGPRAAIHQPATSSRRAPAVWPLVWAAAPRPQGCHHLSPCRPAPLPAAACAAQTPGAQQQSPAGQRAAHAHKCMYDCPQGAAGSSFRDDRMPQSSHAAQATHPHHTAVLIPLLPDRWVDGVPAAGKGRGAASAPPLLCAPMPTAARGPAAAGTAA